MVSFFDETARLYEGTVAAREESIKAAVNVITIKGACLFVANWLPQPTASTVIVSEEDSFGMSVNELNFFAYLEKDKRSIFTGPTTHCS